MLSFAFFLGVVFITFNFLWSLFTFVLGAFIGEVGKTEKYILRITQAYFLASMTALATIDFGNEHQSRVIILLATGIVTLFLYLISKIEQRKNMIQFNLQLNRKEIRFSKNNLKYDVLIACLTVSFYGFSVFYLPMVDNVANQWFFETIQNLYATPIIGWIIGFIGIFFIISIFIKGIVAVQLVFDQVGNLFGSNTPKDDDDFVDYEEVEDDEMHKYIED